jgi:hypothetical protein
MRKLLTFLIALASIALGAYTSASAQSIGVRTAILSKPPAAAYKGPDDVTTWQAFWSLRAYSAATRGTKLANVCNSTGGVDVGCADMLSDAVTGNLVSATISGITCPGANCTVKTLYDQVGTWPMRYYQHHGRQSSDTDCQLRQHDLTVHDVRTSKLTVFAHSRRRSRSSAAANIKLGRQPQRGSSRKRRSTIRRSLSQLRQFQSGAAKCWRHPWPCYCIRWCLTLNPRGRHHDTELGHQRGQRRDYGQRRYTSDIGL